jgi:hypothetical protein
VIRSAGRAARGPAKFPSEHPGRLESALPIHASPHSMHAPDQAEIDRLLKGVDIPACSAILSRLQKEIASSSTSLASLGSILGDDVGSFTRMNDDSIWQRGREPVMAHLDISGNDLFDLRETAFETLEHM